MADNGSEVEVRLQGARWEVARLAVRLAETLTITSRSKFYVNDDGKTGRIYLRVLAKGLQEGVGGKDR